MNLTSGKTFSALLALPLALVVATGCGGGMNGTASTSPVSTALSTALSSSSTSAGTLLCSPAQGQLDACAGKAAADACTLTLADGTTTVAGTCRATIDGADVACVPNPPAPPQELVDACTGKVASAACTVSDALGDTRNGVCVTARDGSTLICGRAMTPPQPAIDACASATVGADCSFASMMATGAAMVGVCSYGPAGTGTLACSRRQDVLPHGTNACAGLAVGATCRMGRRQEMSGVCTTPGAGGDAVCLVPCASAGGEFDCRPGSGGPGGQMGPGGMGGGMMGGR